MERQPIGQNSETLLYRAFNLGRYLDVLLAYGRHVFTFSKSKRPFDPAVRRCWWILLAAAAGCFFVYILAPAT